jgi:hypothetical protein
MCISCIGFSMGCQLRFFYRCMLQIKGNDTRFNVFLFFLTLGGRQSLAKQGVIDAFVHICRFWIQDAEDKHVACVQEEAGR